MRDIKESIANCCESFDDVNILMDCVCSIAARLCIHQIMNVEEVYYRMCQSRPKLKERRQFYDEAIEVCKKTTLITGITPDGIAYQTLSLCYPIKSDEDLRPIIHHY